MNGIHNHRNTCQKYLILLFLIITAITCIFPFDDCICDGIVVCKWISFGIAFCCCILLTSFVGPSLFADLEGAAKDASVIKIPFLLTTIGKIALA